MEDIEMINTLKINRIKEVLETKDSLSNITNALLTMQKIVDIVYPLQQATGQEHKN